MSPGSSDSALSYASRAASHSFFCSWTRPSARYLSPFFVLASNGSIGPSSTAVNTIAVKRLKRYILKRVPGLGSRPRDKMNLRPRVGIISKIFDVFELPGVEVKLADKKDSTLKILSDNRQAFHNYFLLERFECGMVLTGTEVKEAKDGKVQLK